MHQEDSENYLTAEPDTYHDNVNDPKWANFVMDNTSNLPQLRVGDKLVSAIDKVEVLEVGEPMIFCGHRGDELINANDRVVRLRVIETYSPDDSTVSEPGESFLIFYGDLIGKDGEYKLVTTIDPNSLWDQIENLKAEAERNMNQGAFELLDRLQQTIDLR